MELTLTGCKNLSVSVTPNLSVGTLIHNVMVFGSGGFGR